MTYPEIKLVDAPTAAAAVLFDFNDITATPYREVLADEFSIGAPEPIGEVDAIDPLYGERMVSFTCRMKGTKTQVAAAQSTLSRRLLAPGQGWLRVRMTATSRLLFFRTYRPQPGDLSLDLVQSTSTTTSDSWLLEVNLPCEPFGYGERVTLASQTVTNDAAAGTNPLRIVLPAILGDAPAPLRVQTGSAEPQTGERWMLALHSGTAQRAPASQQIGGTDGFTAYTDTGASTAAAGFSGGTYRAVTFATNASLVERLRRPGYPAGMVPGRYKILVRTVRPDLNSVFSLRFTQRSYLPVSGSVVVTAMGAVGVANHATWIDLGDHALPAYGPPKGQGTSLPTAGTASEWSIDAGRVSGTGELRLDVVLFVPLDVVDTSRSSALISHFMGESGVNGGTNLWDGDEETFWSLNSSAAAMPIAVAHSGRFPAAVPGASNVLTVLRQVNSPGPLTVSAPDQITATTPLTVSYHPRFLYLGDS